MVVTVVYTEHQKAIRIISARLAIRAENRHLNRTFPGCAGECLASKLLHLYSSTFKTEMQRIMTDMAKVFLICGKICCGKSAYAERLRFEHQAVVLSVDEIMLSLFGLYAGEKHDEYTERLQNYLFSKSAEIVETGMSVILDWGFWTREKRKQAREFYWSRHIDCEVHYLDISDNVWRERIVRRNRLVSSGEVSAYYLDENFMTKFQSLFEVPGKGEVDVWINE